MISSPRNNRGFTLVEALVYGVGLVIILGGIVTFIFYLYGWYTKATLPIRVDQAGIALVSRITNDIRGANSTNDGSSTYGTQNGAISVTTMLGNFSTTTRYYLSNGKIYYTINAGGSAVLLSPEDLWISRFEVNKLSNIYSTAVRIKLGIDYWTSKTGTSTNNYYNLAILRQSYD